MGVASRPAGHSSNPPRSFLVDTVKLPFWPAATVLAGLVKFSAGIQSEAELRGL